MRNRRAWVRISNPWVKMTNSIVRHHSNYDELCERMSRKSSNTTNKICCTPLDDLDGEDRDLGVDLIFDHIFYGHQSSRK